VAAAAVLVCVLAALCVVLLARPGGRSSAGSRVTYPPVPYTSVPAGTSTAGTDGPAAGSPSLQAPVDPPSAAAAPGVPVHLSVARVGIDSALEPLGLLADGTLQSPSTWEEAGWYAKGIRPGAVGPAVIVGHVDSVSGPAVFYRLRELRPGDDIAVRDSLGTVRHFTVTDVKEYPKTVFPTTAVYGPTPLPVLRLVTCTGDFDYHAHSYLDNLVVSADLAAPVLF